MAEAAWGQAIFRCSRRPGRSRSSTMGCCASTNGVSSPGQTAQAIPCECTVMAEPLQNAKADADAQPINEEAQPINGDPQQEAQPINEEAQPINGEAKQPEDDDDGIVVDGAAAAKTVV